MKILTFFLIQLILYSCNVIEILTQKDAKIEPEFFGCYRCDEIETKNDGISFESQNFTTSFVTVPQGLSSYSSIASNYIEKIYIDDNGIIYIATWGGLSISYDGGNTFFTATTANGLGGNKVKDIKVVNGDIYVATYGGLSISEDGGLSFINKTSIDGIIDPNNSINALDVANGKIYLATGSGVSISDDLTATNFTNFNTTSTPSIISNSVRDISVSGTNVIIGTNSGASLSKDSMATISNYDNGNGLSVIDIWSVYTTGPGFVLGTSTGVADSVIDPVSFSVDNTTLVNNDVREIFVDSAMNNYVATAGGVSLMPNNQATFTESFTNSNSGLISDDTRTVFVDSVSNLYVGTNLGLSVLYNGDTNFTSIKTDDGFIRNNIKDVFVDKNKIIYVSTQDGLFTSDDGGVSFKHILSTVTDINSIFVDDLGSIYLGSATLGLFISNDGGASFINKSNANHGLVSDIVSKVYVDSGKIYVATSMGLSISADLSGDSYTNITDTSVPSISNKNVKSVHANGNQVLLATFGGGLFLSSDGASNFTNLNSTNNSLANDIVYDVFVAANGDFYAATISGLSKSTDSGVNFSSIFPSSVNNVYIDSSNNIFIASTDGLRISTDGGTNFTHFNTLNGLGDKVTNKVTLDEDGNLYVATAGGLARSTPLFSLPLAIGAPPPPPPPPMP